MARIVLEHPEPLAANQPARGLRGPSIMDRYLLKQFVQSFVICFISLTGLYIVFDAFANLDEFMRAAEKQGSLGQLMGEFYAYRTIYFFDRTAGILTLVSAMFTVTFIQRHNELTALMAAGISRGRVLKPVLIACVIICFAASINRELLMPRYRRELSRSPKDLLGDAAQNMRPVYDKATGILFDGKNTFVDKQRIHDPKLLLPGNLNAYSRNLVAEDAFYLEADEHHPAGYLLRGVSQPSALSERKSLPAQGDQILFMPRDHAAWLQPNECFIKSDLSFEQLTGGRNWRQFASTWELITGLRNPNYDALADVRVAIHSRFVQPWLDVTLLFIGLPLIVARENRNVYAAIGLCVAVVSLFMVVVIGCQAMGSSYLIGDPALASWLPLLLFAPAAAWMAQPFRE